MPAIYKETIFADLCILQAKGQYRFFRRGYVPVEGLIHDKSGRNKLTCYKVHLHISIHIHAIVQCDDGFPIHNGLLFASFVNRKVDRRRGHLCFERPHLQRTRRNHIMKRTNNPIRIDQLLSGKRDGILLTTTERCARHETSPHKKFTKWTNRLKRRIICSYSACDTVQTDRGSRREFPLTSLKVVQHKVTPQLPLIHPPIVETYRSPQQTYGSTRNRTHRHLSSKRKLPRPRSCFIPIENGEGEAPNTKFFEDHTKQARVKLRKGMKVGVLMELNLVKCYSFPADLNVIDHQRAPRSKSFHFQSGIHHPLKVPLPGGRVVAHLLQLHLLKLNGCKTKIQPRIVYRAILLGSRQDQAFFRICCKPGAIATITAFRSLQPHKATYLQIVSGESSCCIYGNGASHPFQIHHHKIACFNQGKPGGIVAEKLNLNLRIEHRKIVKCTGGIYTSQFY